MVSCGCFQQHVRPLRLHFSKYGSGSWDLIECAEDTTWVSTAMLSTDIYMKTLQLLHVIEPILKWKLPETYQDVLVAGHIRKVRPELLDQPWAARCDIMLVGDLMDTCHVHDLPMGDQGLELKCSMQAGNVTLLHLYLCIHGLLRLSVLGNCSVKILPHEKVCNRSPHRMWCSEPSVMWSRMAMSPNTCYRQLTADFCNMIL